MRLGVKFTRTGRTRFVSHLDMQRLFSRALRRAGLPVKFSQGFNPHIITSFASALAVGMESYGDYMEFYTVEDIPCEEIKTRLNAAMPYGIEILKVGVLDEKAPKLMAASRAALVEIKCDKDRDKLTQGIKEILSKQTYICSKKSKGKMREFDIRPLIYSDDITPDVIKLTLAHSGSGSLSPAILIKAAQMISGAEGEPYAVRLDLLIEKDGELVSMAELF